MGNQNALKWLVAVILHAASSLRFLISSLPLAIAVLLIFQFTAAGCTSTWVLAFWISEFDPISITLPLKTQLILSINYLDLSIILASKALNHPKVDTITVLTSTLLKVLCKPSNDVLPLGIFLLGLLQLALWETHNEPTTKLGKGLAVACVKGKKIALTLRLLVRAGWGLNIQKQVSFV